MKIIPIEQFKEKLLGLLSQHLNLQRVTYPYLTLYHQNIQFRPINFDNKLNTVVYQFNLLETNEALLQTFLRVVVEDDRVMGVISEFQNIQRDTFIQVTNTIIETNFVLLKKIKAIESGRDETVLAIGQEIFTSINQASKWGAKESLRRPILEIMNFDQTAHYPMIIRQVVGDRLQYRCQVWNETVGKHFDLFTLWFEKGAPIGGGGKKLDPEPIPDFLVVNMAISKLVMWLANARHISECVQSPWTEEDLESFRKRGIEPW